MTTMDVLGKINAIYKKQNVHKPIGVDTLLLMLKVEAKVLLPLLNDLQSSLDIVYHPAKSSKGVAKYGFITLISVANE